VPLIVEGEQLKKSPILASEDKVCLQATNLLN
jgi:hypothetical protein